MGKELEQTFLRGIQTVSEHEMVLNFISNQRNVKYLLKEIIPHTVQNV